MFLMREGQLFGWSETLWTLLYQFGILAGLATTVVTIVLAVVAWVRRDQPDFGYSARISAKTGPIPRASP